MHRNEEDEEDEEGRKETVYPMLYSWRNRRDIDARDTRKKAIQYFCGLFTVVVALAIHLWAATLAWFSTYLGPRIGAEAAITAVTAYQDDMLPAILPMYVPMLLFFGIHFVMLLAGKTQFPLVKDMTPHYQSTFPINR